MNYPIPNDDEFVLTGRNRYKNLKNAKKYFAAQERRQAAAEIRDKIFYFQNVLDFGNINANVQALRALKDFLISIDAWDNPTNRAAMIYVVKNKLNAVSRSNYGVFFESKNGKILSFNINPQGKFQAPQSFTQKMDELSSIKVFADMDANLAPSGEALSDETKEIFSVLALYGLCVPQVITGNV